LSKDKSNSDINQHTGLVGGSSKVHNLFDTSHPIDHHKILTNQHNHPRKFKDCLEQQNLMIKSSDQTRQLYKNLPTSPTSNEQPYSVEDYNKKPVKSETNFKQPFLSNHSTSGFQLKSPVSTISSTITPGQFDQCPILSSLNSVYSVQSLSDNCFYDHSLNSKSNPLEVSNTVYPYLIDSFNKQHIAEDSNLRRKTPNHYQNLNLDSPKHLSKLIYSSVDNQGKLELQDKDCLESTNLPRMFQIRTPPVNSTPRVGLLGGTGLDQNPDLFKDKDYVEILETPFGLASDTKAVVGKISNTDVVLIARHGASHDVNPSNVNYRANLWALKNQFNCHVIIATTACGSLRPDIKPTDLVVLDQYIDRTKARASSFYKVSHIPQAEPFDEDVRRCLIAALRKCGYDHHTSGTTVTIEGPRFSTKAESKLYHQWGASIVNMTTVPEAPLAAELGLHYAALALVTDYDCWHEDLNESVSVELVGKRLISLREKAHMVIMEAIKEIEKVDWHSPHSKKMRVASEAIMEKTLAI